MKCTYKSILSFTLINVFVYTNCEIIDKKSDLNKTLVLNDKLNDPFVNLTVIEGENATNAVLQSVNDPNAGPLMTTKSVLRRSAEPKEKRELYFGYFTRDGKYFNCSKPTKNRTAAQDKQWLKCQYFDVAALRLKLDRTFQSDNGFQGVFGYFEFKKFYNCDRPDLFFDIPNRNKTKFIPFYLNYDWKCTYFDNDPKQVYDFNEEKYDKWKTMNSSPRTGLSIALILLLICVIMTS